MTNPLQLCLNEESTEVVDHILGPYLLSCIGKNDMNIVVGLLASAAIIVATHCQTTGENFEEFAAMCRENFASALAIANDRNCEP